MSAEECVAQVLTKMSKTGQTYLSVPPGIGWQMALQFPRLMENSHYLNSRFAHAIDRKVAGALYRRGASSGARAAEAQVVCPDALR